MTAELAFKVSDLNYTGSTEFSFVIPLTAAQRAELDLYLGDCARIQAALEKASEKERPLSFNTSLDGSGVELSFASEDEINASLAAIAQNKYTAVYALYH
ncbi:MAG: hypothetical protein J1D88_02015 [Treponema sp.]|nr:hypothetical protein [Treponema sp.]